MTNEKYEQDIGGIIRDIISYGGSTFAALVAASIYTMTDEYFIGNYVGRDGLGAMALVFPVTLIFTALGTLVEIGGSAVVSEMIGKGRRAEAEAVIRGNYLYVGVFAVVIAVAGNFLAKPLLQSLSDTPDEWHIVGYAVSYLKIILWGMPFLLAGVLTQGFMRCIEKPRHVLYLIFTTSMTNVVLDALMMAVFGMGMEGAALATFISQVLGAAISFWYFSFSGQRLGSPRKLCSPLVMWKEVKIGGGFALAEIMMFFTEFLQNGVILHYDAPQLLAAASISNVILSFAYLPLSGLDTGTQPLVSLLFAEGRLRKCLRVMRFSFFLTMLLTCAVYLALMVFTWELTSFFLPENETATEEMILFLRYSFLLQPCVGLSTWACGVMAALEDEWRNVVINLVPVVVQVPCIYLLPTFLPIEAIALNYSISDFGLALVGVILLVPFLRMHGISLSGIFKDRA